MDNGAHNQPAVPWFGARKLARTLIVEVGQLREQLKTLGVLSIVELEARRRELEQRITEQTSRLAKQAADAEAAVAARTSELERSAAKTAERLAMQTTETEKAIAAKKEAFERESADQVARFRKQVSEAEATLKSMKSLIVTTEDTALLQEAGVYKYRHPLTDAVAYEQELKKIEDAVKAMNRKDGGAVLAITDWTVNGSVVEGRRMVSDFSKLMLRAFNAEADNLVRTLKPYKLDSALDRLRKVVETIERLGKTMKIQISSPYFQVRVRELELTADFLQKEAEEKEAERVEKERLREERKAQQEMERERERLEKERQHHVNALHALEAKGDEEGAARLREQLSEVDRAIKDVDYRAANIRAGYVYLISNIGSFGEKMVKIGMTRRLDPLDRIRELSDASVPFNFDVHALFFSKDAVGIETVLHERFAPARVNFINRRREFFRATPTEVKAHLLELAGELLQFQEVPEAFEYRQCLKQTAQQSSHTSG